MGHTNARIEEMTKLFNFLTEKDQDQLLKALKMQILLAKARRLDASVKKNDISMEEIISVVQQIRQTNLNASA